MAAEEGRSYITWSYAVNEIYSPLIKELTQRGFRVECFEKTTLLIYQYIGNMKLEYTDGCICTSLTVDGKETADMTPEEIKVSIRAMLDRETDIATLQMYGCLLLSIQENIKTQDIVNVVEIGFLIILQKYELC